VIFYICGNSSENHRERFHDVGKSSFATKNCS